MLVDIDHRVSLRIVNSKGNKYCGPAVISTLTGLPAWEAAALVREYYPHIRRVAGLHTWQLHGVLARLGFVCSQIYGRPGHGLVNFVKTHSKFLDQHRATVVAITGHFITISGGMWVDNQQKVPASVEDLPEKYARKHVHKFFTVNL